MSDNKNHLIWIDLEMTGLNPETDRIIEIATVVTDGTLNMIAEGPVFAIHQSDECLNAMDAWNTKQHNQSGLVERVKNSSEDEQSAEEQTLAFLKQYVPEKISPMCGNTVWQDRRFLINYMPQLEQYFHYRMIDVSTIKELAKRWYPAIYKQAPEKDSAHLALQDIRDSIDELKYYRDQLFGKAISEQ